MFFGSDLPLECAPTQRVVAQDWQNNAMDYTRTIFRKVRNLRLWKTEIAYLPLRARECSKFQGTARKGLICSWWKSEKSNQRYRYLECNQYYIYIKTRRWIKMTLANVAETKPATYLEQLQNSSKTEQAASRFIPSKTKSADKIKKASAHYKSADKNEISANKRSLLWQYLFTGADPDRCNRCKCTSQQKGPFFSKRGTFCKILRWAGGPVRYCAWIFIEYLRMKNRWTWSIVLPFIWMSIVAKFPTCKAIYEVLGCSIFGYCIGCIASVAHLCINLLYGMLRSVNFCYKLQRGGKQPTLCLLSVKVWKTNCYPIQNC